MCGIAGELHLNGGAADPLAVRRMMDRMIHRGPDAEGLYSNGPIALGHRRLSIIDINRGHQPMSNEDGGVWVTFNGEIYNFIQLRERLTSDGHRFSTDSDTEVIVHSFEQYHHECVTHFRGMFAFAVWDEKTQTLFLARDRAGKKPLFYTIVNNALIFSSELQALTAHPSISRHPDPLAIDDYMTYGYIPAPRTGFAGVHKLPPACSLTIACGVDGRGVGQVRRYWRLNRMPKQRISEEDATEGLWETLKEAVRVRMASDVPLGALLSGGVDSSAIVALMSELSSKPVKTFSIGFAEQPFNELPHARKVAQQFGTDHHELIVKPSALELLPTLIRHYGEPFADSSAIPTYYVANLTRQYVTVALNGDGGDENLAGYERYLAAQAAQHYNALPAWVRDGLFRPASRLLPDSLPRRRRAAQIKRFVQAASLAAPRRYLHWVTYFSPSQKHALYTPEFQRQLAKTHGATWLLEKFRRGDTVGYDTLDTVLDVDVESYLPYDLLVKMDIATMANSLEARCPFLDHQVMEYCATLPTHHKIRGMTLKYLLKRATAKILPASAVRRRKMGFGIPLAGWLRDGGKHLLTDVLLSRRALSRGYWEPATVTQMVRNHLTGRRDHAYQLWALACLEMWNAIFID